MPGSVKRLDRDGLHHTIEPWPWREPEPNVWVGVDGRWVPLGHASAIELHVEVDTKPFAEALARLRYQFAAFSTTTLTASALLRLYEMAWGRPYFGPREIRRGLATSAALLLVAALLMALVALS